MYRYWMWSPTTRRRRLGCEGRACTSHVWTAAGYGPMNVCNSMNSLEVVSRRPRLTRAETARGRVRRERQNKREDDIGRYNICSNGCLVVAKVMPGGRASRPRCCQMIDIGLLSSNRRRSKAAGALFGRRHWSDAIHSGPSSASL